MRILEEKIRSELMNNSSLNKTLTLALDKKGSSENEELEVHKEIKRLKRDLEKFRSKALIQSNQNDNLK